MRYLKSFESFTEIPKIGDYVLMRTDVKNKNIQNFIKNNTGQIIYLYDSSKKTQKSLASVMNLTR